MRQFWIWLNPSYIGPYNSKLKKYDAFNTGDKRLLPEGPVCHVLEAQPVIELLDKLATDLSVIYQQACSCCESDECVDREANKMIAIIKEFKERIK